MKIALCFIISYSQKLNKEQIWIDWINPNKDIIQVYFHYKDYSTISSGWIKSKAIHPFCIKQTSYTHVVPAYISLMSFALNDCPENQWFIFLTDSCVPIISPFKFRELFFENYSKSIMSWRNAWWNIRFCNRANLHKLQEEFRLANDPWFILKKEDAKKCITYSQRNSTIFDIICQGPIANESIFAIILYSLHSLHCVISSVTHATDWSKMSSATSPYVFKYGNKEEINFITNFLEKNKYTMFLRKVDPSFPDTIISDILYNKDEKYIITLHRRIKLFMLEYYYFLRKNTLFIAIFFFFITSFHYIYNIFFVV